MNVYHKSAVPKTSIKVVYSTLVDWCLSVCTGSAVFAACGLLDGKTATSNKKAFDWVCTCGPAVKWEKEPRFCKDGKFYTSAGVSAEIDMAIEFVKDNYEKEPFYEKLGFERRPTETRGAGMMKMVGREEK